MTMTAEQDSQLAKKWRLLVQATIMTMIVLGAVMLLTPALGEKIFYLVYYQAFEPPADFSKEARSYIRFTNAVLGAVLIGWMVLSYQLVVARSAVTFSAQSAIMLSVGCWFLVDTAFSALHGVWGNVALNVLVAIGILLPLHLSSRATAAI
jgi:hypothetical protein